MSSVSDLQSRVALVGASILLSLFLVELANAAPQHPVRKKPAKQEQAVPPPQPAPPPPPPTLEQMPSLPPKVSFSNGLLTIDSENSTLADILHAVRKQTGAAFEIPPSATERVVTHLGPAPPRDVLASLLNGSHFNYVMLGSPAHPDRVDRVILTSKSGGTPDTAVPTMTPGSSAAVAAPVDDGESPGVEMSEQGADDPAETSAGEEGPQQQQPNGQPQVKTPEQLLQELQRQQQQLQQQQGSPAPPQPPPNRPPE